MNFDLGFYWALLLRRLPMMTLFVLLFSGLGIVTALNLPETYQTSARLLVEAPQIPDSMIRSTVDTGVAEQLDIIQQRLLTRANLIDIANRFDVFEDIRSMQPDEVFEDMQTATRIRSRGAGRSVGATMMTVTFEGRSPAVVANVVNEYVTLLLEENSRIRVGRAENTLDFFQQEVDRLNEELNKRNVDIAQFKADNANSLPQDQPFRLQRQGVLQDRLAQLTQERDAAEQARANLDLSEAATQVVDARSPLEDQLAVGKAELERLREDYSDNNPRVIRLRDQIARLEAVVSANSANQEPELDEADRTQELLEAQRANIDRGIAVLQQQIDATNTELETLIENMSASPSNALRIEELERDYAAVQTRYNSAVSNLNSARMTERLEATSQGQRMSVLESASTPQIPSGPNRPVIAAVGVLIGLGLAVGYFVLLEILNRTVRRPAELIERFDVNPIAIIPYMESKSRRLLRRSARVVALLAVLVGVPALLWYVDTNYIPLELIVQRGMARLGLG